MQLYTRHGQSLELPDYNGWNLEEALTDAADKSFRMAVLDSIHIVGKPGGVNHPLGEIHNWMADLQEQKDDEMVLYCRSGSRSAMAKQFLTCRKETTLLEQLRLVRTPRQNQSLLV